MFNEVLKRIEDRKATVGVVGLGYVGLPLAVEFAKVGFRVYGIDLDTKRANAVSRGESYIVDIPSEALKKEVEAKRLRASSDPKFLKLCDAVIVCVPTPLNKLKEPDISYVLSAVEMLKANLKKGQLLILESTTYPGTTVEVVLPALSNDGLKVGSDFFLCFSPERIDPGNKRFSVTQIPKVVGGVTSSCTKLGVALYSSIIGEVIPVSSPTVAEFTKLLENTFRIVNIGLINELAMVSQDLGINIWEAIEAAKTKPFGFMPFYPGPGIGGHCIGIDPLYLSWKAKLAGSEIRFVELASRISSGMPAYVVKRAAYALNERGKTISRSKILVLGAAYKKDVDDMRESPALEIIEELISLGGKVDYHDPFVDEISIHQKPMHSITLRDDNLKRYDLVIIATDHTSVDYDKIVKQGKLILDTRNVLKRYPRNRKIILL